MIRNLLLLFFCLPCTLLIAQQPPGACPGGTVTPTSLCSEACVLCDIDGYVGQNSITTPGQAPPGFCAPQLHNTQWVGFVAGSTSISMDINVFDCVGGDGLQIGLYGTIDCTNFQQVSNCDPGIPEGQTVAFNASGLTIGGIYFIVIDGNFGDVCSFSVDITDGSTVAPPVTQAPSFATPSSICPGGTFTFSASNSPNASIYTWTVDGQEVAYSQATDLSFPTAGSYTVCVTPSNPCNPPGPPACNTVNVQQPPTQNISATICLGESYQVGNQVLTQSGFYSIPVTLPDGCIELTNLNLTVQPPVFGNDQQSLCPGESYWVGLPGQPGSQLFTSFDSPGQYEVQIQSTSGCDSIVIFNLDLGQNGTEIINENICEGDSYTIVGNTYTETGSYVHNLSTASGCDSTLILVLQVDEMPDPAYLEETICVGEFFFLGNSAYNTTGLYTATVQTPGGCDSVVTLNLTVSAPETELNEIICSGESFTVGNNNYNSTGTYVENLTSSIGCDSVVTLNLQVMTAIETNLVEEICQGETYELGNSDYTSTGNYTQVLTAADGCDSIINLNLTVNPTLTTNLQETVCDGESFTIGTSTYSSSGNYQEMLTSQMTGCDSIVNLNLTVLNAIETDLNAEICGDDTYSVGTSNFDQAGNYEVTLQAANGCDSTVFLNLDVVALSETYLTESVCDGNSFSVGNSTYNSSGQYTDILTASTGCDSVVYLDLNIVPNPTVTQNVAICTGQSYTLGSNTYDSPGTYSATFTASTGCDSTVTVNLTIEDVLEEYVTAEICEGESYTVGNSIYNTTGNYQDQFVTNEGCDSVLYLDLVVNDILETNLVESICNGGTVSIGSSTYSSTGVFTEVLTSTITNCDSVVTLDLTVLDTPVTNLSQSICDGESFDIAGISYNSTGNYQEVLTAANGCDSTINLELTVLDVPQTSLVESICEGITYAVGDSTYTQSGIYQNVLVAANGCDSIVNLNLNILDISETSLTELICDGETYTVGTSSHNTSGTYVETLTAANGCDSVVTLNLTVAAIPTTELVASICIGASYTVGNSTYTSTGTYQDILTSSVGCDSIVNLSLEVTDFYEVNLIESICDGESVSIGNSTYTVTGIYQDNFISSDGCDSIVNLDLTVFDIPITNLTATLCDGETYQVGASNYDVTGIFQDVLTSVITGCDSIVNLDLTVNPTFETNLVEAICDGDSYEVGTAAYTQTGDYQDMLTASNGCDSLVNLSLTVHPILQTDLAETLCFGETYSVGTSTYAQTGIYQDVLTSVVTGCDSIVNLDLVVPELIQTNHSETLCFGETYSVGTSTYSASGTYQDILTADNGCDSLVNLELVVRDQIQTNLLEEICNGETYSVGTSSYTNSGIFQDILTSVETGCDSIVNLDLTVVTIEETVLTQSICDGESVTVGTSTYTESGNYQDILTSTVSGCDSTVSLDLTVYEIQVTNLVEELCFGETYEVGTTNFTQTGVYQEVLTSVETGCDSIVNLDLTIPDLIQTSLNETLCFGETFTVGTSTYSSNGTYQDVLTAANGCDSIVNLDLIIREEVQTDLVEEICIGESYPVGTSSYTTSGIYQDILTSIETGCDSIINLDLTVVVVEETVLTQAICEGESVAIGSSTYTESGNYQDILTSSVSGCDSTVSLNLTVYEIPVTNLVEELCFGETYEVGTITFTQTGVYQEVLTAIETGCDSIVNLDLTIPDLIQTSLNETLCFGETFTVGTSTYSSNGTYQDVLTAANGCDSIVNLDLIIREEVQTDLVEEICIGESYPVGTSSYTTSGIYQDILTSAETGCDSIINLDLTVIVVEETVLTQAICEGESVAIGSSTYTESGNYQDILTSSVSGCDSTVSLNLTVYEIPVTNLVEELCFGETYEVGTITFTQTGVYQEVLTSVETGCDSIVNLDLTIPNLITTSFSQTICFGDSYSVGNSLYTQSGSYQDILTASNGCDSIVNLGLVVRENIQTDLTQEICEGSTYEVGNSVYDQSGQYQDILTSVNTGCDSTVTLDLTVIPIVETMLEESICDGEVVIVGTTAFTETGAYQEVLTSTLTGCDSIVYLDLDVIPIPEIQLVETICDGESFTVGVTNYTTTGSFLNILDASTGCDSIVTLDLTVLPIPETFLVEEICQGETFVVGNSTYDINGDFTDVLVAASGCDSIVHLDLTVHQVYEVFLSEVICDGTGVTIGTNNFIASGNYQEILSTVNGCDSVINLALTVHPCMLSFASEAVSTDCNGSSDGSISFAVMVGTPPYNFTWQSVDGQLSGEGTIEDNDLNTIIQDLPSGLYTFNFIDSFGIEGSFQTSIDEPTPVQVTLDPAMYDDYNISCINESDGAISALPTGGTPPYTFAWSNGTTQQNIDGLLAGVFSVTVTDQNGCTAMMTTTLIAPTALNAVAEATDPPCFGDAAGSISILEPNGGVGPYLYAIEAEPFTASPIFAGLSIGEYAVHVQDANGCIWTEFIQVNEPEELTVDIVGNQRIGLGEIANIEAVTSYPVDSYAWKGLDTLGCTNCPAQNVRPFSTATYEVTVMDENGCTDSDLITIFVGKEREVYIPNVFSPNEDGNNDVFRIFAGSDVSRIKSFYVFNRWGESMIELFNFMPDDPAYHWDGRHRGQIVNSGVYVYFAEIEFIDGEVVMYKGDVLLMK